MGRKSHKKVSRKVNTETGIEKISCAKSQLVHACARVPDEIFYQIFLICSKDGSLPNSLKVCRRWHTIGNSLLWTHLRLNLGKLKALGTAIRKIPALATRCLSLTLHTGLDYAIPGNARRRLAEIRICGDALQSLKAVQCVSLWVSNDRMMLAALIRSLPVSVSHFELTLQQGAYMSGMCGNSFPVELEQHICACLADKMAQFKTVQLRGAPPCFQLYQNTLPGSVDLTIDLTHTRTGYRGGQDTISRNLTSEWLTRDSQERSHPFKSIKVISYMCADPTEDVRFDFIAVRDVLRGQVTSSPARIMNPIHLSLPMFLRVPNVIDDDSTDIPRAHVHKNYTQYYADTWAQIAALHNGGMWREDLYLGIRLPPASILGRFPESSQLNWSADLAKSTPKTSRVLSILQTMHEELFQYENAAQCSLLLPLTDVGVSVTMERRLCPQERAGTYIPATIWMPEEANDENGPFFIVDKIYRGRM